MNRSPQVVARQLRTMESLLRDKGLAVTHQRLTVYRHLLGDESHPSAEQIFERVRAEVPTISLGTVYKTLDMLRDLGAIAEVDSPRNAARYEAILEPHHHLVCEDCGKIVDLYERKYGRLRLPPGAAEGFEVTSCTVQFRGKCRDCRKRSNKQQRSRRA